MAGVRHQLIRAAILALGMAAMSCDLIFQPDLVVSDWNPRTPVVAADAELWIDFSLDMDQASAEKATTLSENGSGVELRYGWSGKRLRCVPIHAIQKAKRYILRVAQTAESSAGINLKDEFRQEFSTSDDVTRPLISAISPIDRSVLDDPLAPVSVQFSEAVDHESWYRAFSVSPGLSYDWSWAADGTTVTGVPRTAMDWQSEYRVRISTDLADLAGNTLGEDKVWRFRLGAGGTAPVLASALSLEPVLPAKTAWVAGASVLHPLAVPAASLISDDGWEADWGIELRFSAEVKRENLESLITVSPAWSYRIDSTAEWVSSVRLIPQERFAVNSLHELVVQKGLTGRTGLTGTAVTRFRFRTDGPGTQPPSVDSWHFRLDPSLGAAGVSWFDLAGDHSGDFSTMVLPIGEFPVHANSTSYVDLLLRLATGANLDIQSLRKNISISSTNSAIAVSIVAIETGGFANPQPAAVAGTQPVRLWLSVNPDTPSGLLQFRVTKGFQDSRGNALTADQIWTVLK